MTTLTRTTDTTHRRPILITPPQTQTLDQHVRGPARRACTGAAFRVLLLEPDVAIAALMTDILADAGYAVDHLARPDTLDSYLACRGHPACDLLLSTPYTDPLRAPYAWLDACGR